MAGPTPKFQLSTRGLMLLVLGCGLLGWLLAPLVQSRLDAREKERCARNLRAIGLAMHQYHDKYGHFPPAYVADARGKPLHSWRVLLLEFLDPVLFREYDFNEPWDGPHNRTLAGRMPACYACPDRGDGGRSPWTSYVAIVGPETAFPGDQAAKFVDFQDGVSNTLLLVEVARPDFPWMAPRDLTADAMSLTVNDRARPGISSTHPRGASVLLADGRALFVTNHLAPQVLKIMITKAGGEVISDDAY